MKKVITLIIAVAMVVTSISASFAVMNTETEPDTLQLFASAATVPIIRTKVTPMRSGLPIWFHA